MLCGMHSWSGQKYYFEIAIQFFNLFFTSLPILVLAAVDRCVCMVLYVLNIFGYIATVSCAWYIICLSTYTSVVCIHVCMLYILVYPCLLCSICRYVIHNLYILYFI